MAARSIASLSLSFGLVSIPVKVYSATESAAGIGFNLLHKCGSRVRQQYVCIKENVPVERADMVKGYEFDKDRYVMFEPAELKALEEGSRHTIDIVSFVPLASVDPIYYDKAYYLAPDKRGAKPYGLLMQAMKKSGRCALATWAWKGKQYVVQVRPGDDGLVLQQLLYADEVRSMKDLQVEQRRRAAERARAGAAADRADLERQLRPGGVQGRGEGSASRRPSTRRSPASRSSSTRKRRRPPARR